MRQVIAGLVVLVLFLATPAQATHWDRFLKLCFEDLLVIEEIPEIPVPVGCEVVDCCPGCPGPPDYLEWRILVDKNARSVEIRLEGVDELVMSGMKLRGNVTRKGNVLTAGPGESFVTGLPNARKGSVAVGVVKVMPNAEQIRALSAPDADAEAKDEPDSNSGVEIYQLAGKYVVNKFRSRLQILPCHPPPPLREDRIRLTNNTSNDNAVILADYRQAACRNDLIHRTMTEVFIGNALTNGTCNSDVSVFSDDNAMSFEPNVTTWTNTAGDIHTVNLRAMLTAPVTVWIAMAGATPRAQNDVANANLLYNQNNVGVRFNATFNDVSGNANAVTTIGGTNGGCATAGALAGTAFHTVGRINIYYVNGAFTGVNCGANRNVSFIGTTSNLGSLPHEIAHAYALRPSDAGGHTNTLAGFGNNNIMFAGGPGTRNHFSVGQAFRINVSDISQLNVNGTRVGTTRACAPLTTSNICPALALDSLPH